MLRLKVYLMVIGVLCGLLLAAPTARAAFLYVTDTGGIFNNTRNVSSAGVVSAFPGATTTAPQGIAVNLSGTFAYVTNNTGNSISTINASTGAVTTNFITGLSGPIGVATDKSGNIYVVNGATGKVGKFNSAGGTINANFITGLTSAQYVAVDGVGNVYVTGSNGLTGTLQKYSSAGGGRRRPSRFRI